MSELKLRPPKERRATSALCLNQRAAEFGGEKDARKVTRDGRDCWCAARSNLCPAGSGGKPGGAMRSGVLAGYGRSIYCGDGEARRNRAAALDGLQVHREHGR